MGNSSPSGRYHPRRIIAACVLAFCASQVSAEVCAPDTLELRGAWGQASFSVEIVDTPATRAQGLMFRESMPATTGMLFVYEAPSTVAFWMKNTLIPLDMIFADASGTVHHVHSNAIPGDLTAIPGGDNILAVLEINGGLSNTYGIGPGTQMRHPAFTDAPVWSCE
jgi:uncharacterized membrane protein (UPF0127 family)